MRRGPRIRAYGSLLIRNDTSRTPSRGRAFPSSFLLAPTAIAFSSSSSRALHSSKATRRRSRRRPPPPPFVFPTGRRPRGRRPRRRPSFCLDRASGLGRVRRRGGFPGGGGLGEAHPGTRALPGRRGPGRDVPSPLPANTRVRQPPSGGRGGAGAASRLGLLLQPAERAGPVLLHLVLVHVPSPDSDGLAHRTRPRASRPR